MDDKLAQNDRRNGKWTPVLVAVISAAVGSVGGISIYLGTPIGQKVTRPDSYTGAQAKAAHNAIDSRMSHLESSVGPHLANYPQVLASFEARVAVLESKYDIIINNQNRILDRLDGR